MMSERDRDPYAPPECEVELPVPEVVRRRQWVDQALRTVGVGCMGCLVVRSMMHWYSAPGVGMMVWMMVVTGMACMIAAGFLYGGRKWQLVIGVFLFFLVGLQVLGVMRAVEEAMQTGAPMGAMFWLEHVPGLLAFGGPMVCGFALYVLGGRAIPHLPESGLS